jgi:meso-butanediol dehydrogenase/(S,S)-butanediol dehydrogenase/diacetyl reductase
VIREGAKVLIVDREPPSETVADELEALGDAVSINLLDVTNRSAVRDALAGSTRIDLVVNNAGIAGVGEIADIDDDTWRRVIEVDAHAPLIMVQEALPMMGPDSAIVNVTSLAAFLAFRSQASYAVAKAGLVALTRNMAFELGPRGIRANAVAPGPTVTELFAANSDPVGTAAREARTALGRLGRPEEIASAVAFLGSTDASYITGTTLVVDGGFVGGGVR